MANKDFREGLSLALDRNDFAAKATSGSKGFTGLLNDLYLANVSTGESYRSTEQGKSVYNAVYGTLGGATPDEAKALPESSTGYNKTLAAYYVAKGLEDELASSESGHLASGNTIAIEFRVYDDTSSVTKNMVLKHRADVKEAKRDLKRYLSVFASVDKEQAAALKRAVKEADSGTLDLTPYLPLFEKAIAICLEKQQIAVKKTQEKLQAFLAKHQGDEDVNFPEAEKELKALYGDLRDTDFALEVEPDNILSVFPSLVHDIVIAAKQSVVLDAKLQKDLSKYHGSQPRRS